MKFYLFVFSLFVLTACQKPKDWDCTCEYDGIYGSGTKSGTITNKKQEDANEDCTQYGKSLTGGNGTYKCKLTVK